MPRFPLSFCKIILAFVAIIAFSGLIYLSIHSEQEARLDAENSVKIEKILFQNDKSLRMVKDRTLADKLAKEIRILCWIAVTDMTLDGVPTINETWGKRCTKILFMGDESTKGKDGIISLDIGNGRDTLWTKTLEAFKYIAKNHLNEADWILKADTDTYVIMENLRYLLLLQDPTKPQYLGCHIKNFIPKGYNSGGAGYVINRSALKKLIMEGFEIEACANGYRQAEDISLGLCLDLIGIPPGDTTDEYQKNRFFPFTPYDHATKIPIGNRNWYYTTGHKPAKKALDCCSETVASFHYITVEVFWTMEYLLYHTQLYGVTHSLTQKH